MTYSQSDWQTPIQFPALKKQQAHVWYAVLDYGVDDVSNFFKLLTSDEKIRAQRFHFEKDRNYFITSRGILRTILGNYLDIIPQKINFSYNQYGKPFLADYPQLQFNLSHSQNLALFAFTFNYSIGVDIEYMQRDCDIDAIAQRFFSAREYAVLKKLSAVEKKQAFFNAWARKEAFLKAIGQGLSYALENVEVSLLANEPAKFLAIHDEKENIEEWLLYVLEPAVNYVAALAVKGHLKDVALYQWQKKTI